MRTLLQDNTVKDSVEDWVPVFLSQNIRIISAAVKLAGWTDFIQFLSEFNCDSLPPLGFCVGKSNVH